MNHPSIASLLFLNFAALSTATEYGFWPAMTVFASLAFLKNWSADDDDDTNTRN